MYVCTASTSARASVGRSQLAADAAATLQRRAEVAPADDPRRDAATRAGARGSSANRSAVAATATCGVDDRDDVVSGRTDVSAQRSSPHPPHSPSDSFYIFYESNDLISILISPDESSVDNSKLNRR